MEKNNAERNYILQCFKDVAKKYLPNSSDIEAWFSSIEKPYLSRLRGYHDFNHIVFLVNLWDGYKDRIGKKDEIFFAIMYHDIVYKPIKSNNEEASARRFKRDAKKLGLSLSKKQVDYIFDAIMATKHNDSVKHLYENDNDIKYFLDFDLYVLSSEENVYEKYREGVRKEYKIYPDALYKPGRRKVLESFLQRERIYLTDDIRAKRENFARNNLRNEINSYL